MDLTKVLSVVKSKKTGFFAAGVLFGTAGIKALSSKDAKKLYTRMCYGYSNNSSGKCRRYL